MDAFLLLFLLLLLLLMGGCKVTLPRYFVQDVLHFSPDSVTVVGAMSTTILQ